MYSIDLTHNDVKQCFRGSNVHWGSCDESNIASYFPEGENLNGSNADMRSNVAGPSSSGSGDLFDFGSSSRFRSFTISPLLTLLAAILDLNVTTTPTLPFGACDDIMYKVY